jgi:hypothetical protein
MRAWSGVLVSRLTAPFDMPRVAVAAARIFCVHVQIALFENMGRLLADVRAYVRRGRTRDVPGMLGKLVETSNRVCAAISTHMQREEAEVLPLLAAALGAAEQRGIVWHTLRWATAVSILVFTAVWRALCAHY